MSILYIYALAVYLKAAIRVDLTHSHYKKEKFYM